MTVSHLTHATQVYDPHGTGFADNETLRRIFHDLGYGDISDEDLEVPAAEPIPRRMAAWGMPHTRTLEMAIACKMKAFNDSL